MIEIDLTDEDWSEEREKAKKFRILTILLNLSRDELNLTCDSPTLGFIGVFYIRLLNICINTDILVISNKAYKIIVNLSKTISLINHECSQILKLIKSFEKTLEGRNRKQIINEKNNFSSMIFNNFDIAIIIELLSVLDYEIIVHSLLALQVITIKVSFRPPTSKLITFIHSIILFITHNDLQDILSEKFLEHPKLPKFEINAVDKNTKAIIFHNVFDSMMFTLFFVTILKRILRSTNIASCS
ncbi:hypothetical protein MXB_3299 [Myxobolus squamalis]|nr:hypothetical protein MXB_3299 [Myxobolus squamalis]